MCERVHYNQLRGMFFFPALLTGLHGGGLGQGLQVTTHFLFRLTIAPLRLHQLYLTRVG